MLVLSAEVHCLVMARDLSLNYLEKLYIACLQTNSLAMIIILSGGHQKVMALPYIDYGLSH